MCSTKFLALPLLVLAGCGGSSNPLIGQWTSTVSPSGTPSSYNDLMSFDSSGSVAIHTVSVGLGPAGCQLTTDIEGTFTQDGSGANLTVSYDWNDGMDALANCTDPSMNAITPYTADQLNNLDGVAMVILSNDNMTLALTQTVSGVTSTQTFTRSR